MKYFIVILLIIGTFAFGVEKEDFDSVVEFSVTLEKLDAAIKGKVHFDPDKFLILNGLVEMAVIAVDDEDGYLAVVDLIEGQWSGDEEILTYHCRVVFQGPEFRGKISDKPDKDPETVSLNAEIMVVGKLVDIIESEEGELIPVLEAVYARSL